MLWVEVKIPFDQKTKYVIETREDSEVGGGMLVIAYNEKTKDWESCCGCRGFTFSDIIRYIALPDTSCGENT